MIRLLELYPDHLNLNGDRGNLLILQRRLEWAGVTAQHFTHRPGQPLPATRPEFVLLGHGSPAAWRQIYADLARIMPQLEEWMHDGTQLLAVSSGYAALHGLMKSLPVSVEKRERQSKFEVVETQKGDVIGYLNSDLVLEPYMQKDNLIATLLHGPVLAKSVWLADHIIEKMLDGKTVDVDNVQKGKFSAVQAFARGASELAKELARE